MWGSCLFDWSVIALQFVLFLLYNMAAGSTHKSLLLEPPSPPPSHPLGPYRALYRLPTSCVLHARWRTPVNAPLLFVPYISVYVTESRKTVLMHLFAGVETQT